MLQARNHVSHGLREFRGFQKLRDFRFNTSDDSSRWTDFRTVRVGTWTQRFYGRGNKVLEKLVGRSGWRRRIVGDFSNCGGARNKNESGLESIRGSAQRIFSPEPPPLSLRGLPRYSLIGPSVCSTDSARGLSPCRGRCGAPFVDALSQECLRTRAGNPGKKNAHSAQSAQSAIAIGAWKV